MLTPFRRRSAATLALSALLSFACIPAAHAQDLFNDQGNRIMPEGWQELPPDELLPVINVFFSKPWPAAAQREEVLGHIWTTHLSDPEFVANAEWEVLKALFKKVVSRRSQLPDEIGEAQFQAVRAMFEQRFAAKAATGDLDFENLEFALTQISRLGASKLEVASKTADWVGDADLALVPAANLPRLIERLNDPLLPRGVGRAVYEGTITLPASGNYTLSRYLNNGIYTNDYVVVTLGSTVVLDTRPNEAGEATVPGPISLQAGTRAFTAEFYRSDAQGEGVNGEPAEHLLRWQLEDQPPVLIPASVFHQPDGSTPGLRARYYNLVDQDPVAERVVAAVDRPSGSIAQRYRSQLDALVTELTDQESLSALQAETAIDASASPREFWTLLSHPLSVLGAGERKDLIVRFCNTHPAWLGSGSPGRHMEGAMRALAAVPLNSDGSGPMVTLIHTWSSNRPRLTTQIGPYVGQRYDEYLKINDNPYERLGWMMGYYPATWPMILAVRDACIFEPDGGCDLEVLRLYLDSAKVASDPRGSRASEGIGEVRAFVDQALDNPELSGDAKASWLVGQAIVTEASPILRGPSPMRGMRSLEMAFATAESEPVRLWVLSEMVTRLISVGEADKALSLIASVEGQFTGPDAQARFTFWRDQAPQLESRVQEMAKARRANENLSRVRREIEDLQQTITRLEAVNEPGRLDSARSMLDQAKQQLTAKQAELAQMESADGRD
jgi:hypothetical protein